jgi:hypothetical protein
MTAQEQTQYTNWARPREVGDVMVEGHPRELPGSPSGFDLSWGALDAWAKSKATGEPCEIILVGYARRVDGFYWYIETLNPAYLREVRGWVERGGELVEVCPECDTSKGRHLRGCSLRP